MDHVIVATIYKGGNEGQKPRIITILVRSHEHANTFGA